MEIDRLALVDIVKKYPIIWNKNDVNFNKPASRKIAWQEIAKELNIQGKFWFYFDRNFIF